MDYKITCPHCRQPLEVPKEMLGQAVECPTCNNQFKLPNPAIPAIPRAVTVPRSAGTAPTDAVTANVHRSVVAPGKGLLMVCLSLTLVMLYGCVKVISDDSQETKALKSQIEKLETALAQAQDEAEKWKSGIVRLAATLESADPVFEGVVDFRGRDTDAVTARIIDAPTESKFWESYRMELEGPGAPPLRIGSHTDLDQVQKRAFAQLLLLNRTRQQLTTTRNELVDTIAELNALKRESRRNLAKMQAR